MSRRDLLMQSEMTLDTKTRGAREGGTWVVYFSLFWLRPVSLLPPLLSTRQPCQAVGTTSRSTPGRRPICAAFNFVPTPEFLGTFYREYPRTARRRLDSKDALGLMATATARRLGDNRGVLLPRPNIGSSNTDDRHMVTTRLFDHTGARLVQIIGSTGSASHTFPYTGA